VRRLSNVMLPDVGFFDLLSQHYRGQRSRPKYLQETTPAMQEAIMLPSWAGQQEAPTKAPLSTSW
jgi:hypothetical protein